MDALKEVPMVVRERSLERYIDPALCKEVFELLSADQKRVLSLDYHGYNVNEIAEMMNVKSVNTIKSLLRRARLRSRKLFWSLSQPLSPNNGKSSRKARDDTDDDWGSFLMSH